MNDEFDYLELKSYSERNAETEITPIQEVDITDLDLEKFALGGFGLCSGLLIISLTMGIIIRMFRNIF